MNARSYFGSFVIPLVCVAQLLSGPRWPLLTVVFVFGLIPLLDSALPLDTRNDAESAESDASYRRLLYAMVVADTAVLVLALLRASGFGAEEFLGHALAVGIVTGGIGITVAHELMHKPRPLEQFFAHFALLTVGYMHFVVEHVIGHHTRAATPEDPATARRGESVYGFVVRSVRDSWKSAWHLESMRLRKRGEVPWSPRNAMISYTVLPLVLTCGIVRVLGPAAGLFFVLQAAVAIILLEIVNYVEHYGLLRARSSVRRPQLGGAHGYEPFTAKHAWDSDHWLSNHLLFRLARHADHHQHATRPYQILRHLDDSPKMPAGYPAMMLLALLPPLWRAVMDGRLNIPAGRPGA